METAATTVPNTFPALFWAYSVLWALFVIYFVALGRRLSKLERNLNNPRKEE